MTQQRTPPLNVLWITCDEMRASAVSAYGNRFTSMPAAERMAREGVLFEHAYVQMPKCVPSRCSMMTGRYPHCDGFRTLLGRAGAAPGPRGERNNMLALDEGTPNLIPLIRAAGYRTALLGKNHLVDWHLHREWFDATPGWDYDKPPHLPGRVTPRMRELGLEYAGMIDPAFDPARHQDAVTAAEAIVFMRDSRDQGRPFFALVDMAKPHPTYEDFPQTPTAHRALGDFPVPPAKPIDQAPSVERLLRTSMGYESLDDDERRALVRSYHSMCEFADQQVERVLAALDELGLREQTLVIYGSDHGDFAGNHNCYEKWDTIFYDCLVRVPLLIRLPGVARAGVACPAMVELIDLAPTVLELLGQPVPRWMHGRSLAPLLRGQTVDHRDAVFCQGGVEASLTRRPWRPEVPSNKQRVLLEHPESMVRARMVRDSRYKFIYRLVGDCELYDTLADPDELSNLIADPTQRERISHMKDRLLRFMVEFETDLPEVENLIA